MSSAHGLLPHDARETRCDALSVSGSALRACPDHGTTETGGNVLSASVSGVARATGVSTRRIDGALKRWEEAMTVDAFLIALSVLSALLGAAVLALSLVSLQRARREREREQRARHQDEGLRDERVAYVSRAV